MSRFIRSVLLSSAFISMIFFTLAKHAFSQTITEAIKEDNVQNSLSFDEAFQEYLSRIDEYDVAHQDYVLKRAQYLRFKTLKSREEAHSATLVMLQKRDDVIIYYIKALEKRLDEAIGVTNGRRESLNFRTNAEIDWLENHKEVLTSAGSLDDLIEDSDEAKERFSSLQPLVYEVLATISLGRIIDFQERVNDLYNQIKTKVEDIKKEERDEYKLSESKLQTIDRWLFESGNRIIRGEEKQDNAAVKIENLSAISATAFSEYYNSLSLMGETQLFYKEASSFMKEVIREIKIKDQ
ncbi:hypothetical protein A3D01_00265 [Candidatus Woesebacteria bacterium RIFCSPHIGHO2_02_FULL_39_13]|uniref:DUF5667 domain-containing protein n=1 Tax=Candidatus Woesebacteria bacterium RIFCSPHIGHO2_02_FULL_39_13 TaxID=1802505 RepID=A0A1F7Z5K1_9BACT|nr:MAG: hypothetical protein A3D01_00265 [Candidatus Woesebacteria bacterium RIFCSPHIGHO2_02_FULL_39_13]OGM38004.1 MAG: hypothetical protein A3E13_05380 [Candidatus Woesebacteria bacterium RIFCSPHIGHO2_12_FULL_40_20]OGM71824.1 MAG: hypothetical protein A3H19_01670 [Candidatus Woesebacteria bacterium RIFCSPLOWO2_12_FULL_39_9]